MAWNAKVSVVIPTYNRAGFIGAAVESALGQSYSNLEIIVVDDGSTDNTLDVLGSITDRRLEIVRLPRREGGGFARNQGISRATGGFVAFLDSDDIWEPEKLERQIQALAEINYPDRVICYSQVKIAGGLVPVISPGRPLGRNEHISDYLWRHAALCKRVPCC